MSDSLHLSQLWWMDNKMGGYDGYELRPNGELKLLNWDLFIGKSWKRDGNKLTLEMIWRRTGKTLVSDCTVLSETENEMTISEEHKFPDDSVISTKTRLEKIKYNNFSDALLGHWDGE